MKRFRFLSLILMPLLAALLVAGCAKKSSSDDDDDVGPRRPKKKDGAAEVKATPIDVKEVGVVKGRIVYDGDSPGRTSIKSQVEQNKQDKDRCLADKTGDSFETAYWKVGEGKGVSDVVIFIRTPKGKSFPEDFIKKVVGDSPLVIDQPYCAFEPHVSVKLPGQKLFVQNSAPMLHNTKYQGDPVKNSGDNITLQGKTGDNPPEKREITDLKADPKTPVKLQCNAHAWMNGYIWVPETPLVYVTRIKEEGEPAPPLKDGEFEIKNVPAGTELRLAVWHERTGWGEGGQEGVPITVKANDTLAVPDIKIKDK